MKATSNNNFCFPLRSNVTKVFIYFSQWILTKWCILIALNNNNKKTEFSIPVSWLHSLFLPLHIQETELVIQKAFCLLRTLTASLTKLLLAPLLNWFSSTCKLYFKLLQEREYWMSLLCFICRKKAVFFPIRDTGTIGDSCFKMMFVLFWQ